MDKKAVLSANFLYKYMNNSPSPSLFERAGKERKILKGENILWRKPQNIIK